MKLRQAPLRAALVLAGIALATPAAMAAEVSATMSVDTKFHALDTNHDSFITKAEMKRYREYDKAFDEADLNRDGKLSADEFVKAESIYQRLQAAEYVDDSILTAKVKAALVKEMKSLDVSVETYRGHVLLSGFVADRTQRAKAIQVAGSVNGVVKVEDGLVLKERDRPKGGTLSKMQ